MPPSGVDAAVERIDNARPDGPSEDWCVIMKGVTVRTTLARCLLLGATLAGLSACFSPGDPGPPVAYRGSGSDRLGAVMFLLCPNERLLSLVVSEDIGKNAEIKPGRPLWHIEASGSSPTSEFAPGTEPAGFRTVLPAPPSVTGAVAITYKTTLETGMAGFQVRPLPSDVVWFQGRQLTDNAFQARRKDRCGSGKN
jgi:hypothetical protein